MSSTLIGSIKTTVHFHGDDLVACQANKLRACLCSCWVVISFLCFFSILFFSLCLKTHYPWAPRRPWSRSRTTCRSSTSAGSPELATSRCWTLPPRKWGSSVWRWERLQRCVLVCLSVCLSVCVFLKHEVLCEWLWKGLSACLELTDFVARFAAIVSVKLDRNGGYDCTFCSWWECAVV